MTINAKYISAVVTLAVALMGAYLALDRRVNALAATAITASEIEHVVDLKTSAKLDEILRRLERIDNRLDHLQGLRQSGKVAFSKE